MEETLGIIEDLKDKIRKYLAKRKKLIQKFSEIQVVIEHYYSGSKELE